MNISLHTPTPSEANHRWPQDACTRIPSSSPFHRERRSKNLTPKMCKVSTTCTVKCSSGQLLATACDDFMMMVTVAPSMSLPQLKLLSVSTW
ncbi:MAG: hypothetical protein [Circular genetic element sp.]|nr:MAG: hypothetical protein [Circular genetic element sp.]